MQDVGSQDSKGQAAGEMAQRSRRLADLERSEGERHRAEEALRASEERYRNVYHTAPLAFVIWDCDCRVTDWNNRAREMFGWSRKEVLGRNFFEFLIPEHARPRVEDVVDALLRGEIEPDVVNENLTKSGETILCRWNNSILRGRDGQVMGGMSLALDITEQVRAEDALRESEKKYSTLVENSLTGIYIDQDDRIVFANQMLADTYGYPREELIGIESWRLVHPEDRPMTDKIRAKRLQGKKAPTEYEARGLKKDGSVIWVKRRNTKIEYAGHTAILGNVVDVTGRKRAEEQFQRTNRELRNFASVVSHDLKSPIMTIQGFALRLSKALPEKPEGRIRRYLEQITASAHRMEQLVDDLLALSKSGRIVSTFSETPSLAMVRSVTSGLQDRLEEKGIELVVAGELPRVRCDRERICQVFENLIVNAIRSLGTTRNPRIEIGFKEVERSYTFFVKDNGVGIDAKHHRRIFEMFYRVKGKEEKEGTGLGLAIVERIVRAHGGKVWVKSEEGKGATFSFSLPKT
jgi:PAS domain S-box-containing protein